MRRPRLDFQVVERAPARDGSLDAGVPVRLSACVKSEADGTRTGVALHGSAPENGKKPKLGKAWAAWLWLWLWLWCLTRASRGV